MLHRSTDSKGNVAEVCNTAHVCHLAKVTSAFLNQTAWIPSPALLFTSLGTFVTLFKLSVSHFSSVKWR